MSLTQCGNYFCIYWTESGCSLENITLDIQGICQDCIYIELEKETLLQARAYLLNRHGNQRYVQKNKNHKLPK